MWPNPRIPYQMSSDRPRLAPLKGKPIMVNPVVAIEYWPFDRPMPRGILPAPHGRPSEPPDVANYSWVEYGMRCGLPRIFDLFERRGIKASAWMNAQCADVYPSAAQRAARNGWDFVGHSWFQRSLKEVEDEEAEIRRSLSRLEQLTGKRVRGWFGAGGGETMQTPEVLKRCDIQFTHDWLLDDLPCWMATALSTSAWYSSGIPTLVTAALTSASTEPRSRPLTSAVTSRLLDVASCLMTVGDDTTRTLARSPRRTCAPDGVSISRSPMFGVESLDGEPRTTTSNIFCSSYRLPTNKPA